MNENIIDEGYSYINENVISDAELIVFALYPNVFVNWIIENMWSELFMLNKDALLEQFDNFIDECRLLRKIISDEDTEKLKEKMRLSTKRRALFDKK